uniref:Probable E3 ubiquitin-protein ligase ARI8 n=1 Tax=Seriola lalandi dorsalis TaxID=1841481 RepID=A0A3B4WUE1_SERLL
MGCVLSTLLPCCCSDSDEDDDEGTAPSGPRGNYTAGQQRVTIQPRYQNAGRQQQEKCYDPKDSTLRFVNRKDELDCELQTLTFRALMSCGHAVTPMSLSAWCRRLLDKGACKFICGMHGCNVEWPYEEVCKMALLTPSEREYFEKKMFLNCPGCKSLVMREDHTDMSVQCTVCTENKGRTYAFCWQCLRECEAGIQLRDRCENDGCENTQLTTLRICPDITFRDVRGVTGCPSIRACPKCGELVEHDNTNCKNIVCPRCKVEFCFVCLKRTVHCLKTSKHYIQCSSGVAPRQTSIPAWNRK